MNFQKILQTREIINIHTAESITRIKTFCHTVNAKFSSCGEHDSDIECGGVGVKWKKFTGKNAREKVTHMKPALI